MTTTTKARQEWIHERVVLITHKFRQEEVPHQQRILEALRQPTEELRDAAMDRLSASEELKLLYERRGEDAQELRQEFQRKHPGVAPEVLERE